MAASSDPRLLLISFHFPPAETIGAFRVGPCRDYFIKSGWTVDVISKSPEPFPATRTSSATAASGTDSPLPAEPGRSPTTAGRRRAGKTVGRITRRITGHLSRAFLPVIGPETPWLVREILRSLTRASPVPDLILVSGPPFSTFLLARLYSRKYMVPWIADYRDLWTTGGYTAGNSRFRLRLEQWIELRLAKQFSAACTVSEPQATALGTGLGIRRIEVVRNGIDDQRPATVTAIHDLAADEEHSRLHVLYAGEIYHDRYDLSPLFQALAALKRSGEGVTVEFRGSTVEPLREQAKYWGVSDCVLFGPREPYACSVARQRRADALLLVLGTGIEEEGVYSGKLFDYLNARRPILMLGYDAGVAADLVRQRRAGTVANSPQDIEAALHRWANELMVAGHIPDLPPTVAQGLSRSEQFKIMEKLAREVAFGPVPSRTIIAR